MNTANRPDTKCIQVLLLLFIYFFYLSRGTTQPREVKSRKERRVDSKKIGGRTHISVVRRVAALLAAECASRVTRWSGTISSSLRVMTFNLLPACCTSDGRAFSGSRRTHCIRRQYWTFGTHLASFKLDWHLRESNFSISCGSRGVQRTPVAERF